MFLLQTTTPAPSDNSIEAGAIAIGILGIISAFASPLVSAWIARRQAQDERRAQERSRLRDLFVERFFDARMRAYRELARKLDALVSPLPRLIAEKVMIPNPPNPLAAIMTMRVVLGEPKPTLEETTSWEAPARRGEELQRLRFATRAKLTALMEAAQEAETDAAFLMTDNLLRERVKALLEEAKKLAMLTGIAVYPPDAEARANASRNELLNLVDKLRQDVHSTLST